MADLGQHVRAVRPPDNKILDNISSDTITSGAGSGLRGRARVDVGNALDKRFHTAVLPLPLTTSGGMVQWLPPEDERHAGVTLKLNS